MPLAVETILRGSKWTIQAIAQNETCHLREFLSKLAQDDEPEAAKVAALLAYVAETGLPRNTDKCKPIGNDIYEFRTSRVRVLWFYPRTRSTIVCTHAFLKKSQKTPKEEKNCAITLRAWYLSP